MRPDSFPRTDDPSRQERPPAEAVDLLEAYLDGDLEGEAAREFEARLRIDRDLAEELELARAVQSGLRALPRQSCPAPVTRAVLAQTVDAPVPFWRSLPKRLLAPAPLAAAAFAAAATLALTVSLRMPLSTPTPAALDVPALGTAAVQGPADQPTAEDIAQAEEDVKLALAYLGQLGRKAGDSVRRDLIEERLVAPVRRTFGGDGAQDEGRDDV
ncbi:MAG: hypothetical protein AAGD06_15085 [Acidobacteriota bacterium]